KSWSGLGGIGTNDRVRALAVFDDGSGPALYAAGDFTFASGTSANHIARWDGSAWAALGSGLHGVVHALVVPDDGSGPARFAGGEFTAAGGVAANRIARWDGTSWSSIGSANGAVRALHAFDDGGGAGPALYAGGDFTLVGSVPVQHIARWNGAAWSALGAGVSGPSAS